MLYYIRPYSAIIANSHTRFYLTEFEPRTNSAIHKLTIFDHTRIYLAYTRPYSVIHGYIGPYFPILDYTRPYSPLCGCNSSVWQMEILISLVGRRSEVCSVDIPYLFILPLAPRPHMAKLHVRQRSNFMQ